MVISVGFRISNQHVCQTLPDPTFAARRFKKSGATKYAATDKKKSKYRQRLQPVTLDDVAGMFGTPFSHTSTQNILETDIFTTALV